MIKPNFDADDETEDDFPGESNACVFRCKRFRFSPDRQASCISDCDQEDGLVDRLKYYIEDNGDNDFPGNLSACVSRCKRLRFSPANQASCIAKLEDKHTNEGYTPYRFRLNTSEILNPFVLCSD